MERSKKEGRRGEQREGQAPKRLPQGWFRGENRCAERSRNHEELQVPTADEPGSFERILLGHASADSPL